MVGDLVGTSSPRGRTSQFILGESKLRLLKTSSGSLVVEFDIAPPPDGQMHLGYGQQAIDRILDWDGGDDSGLPMQVADELRSIGLNVSEDVAVVRISDPTNHRELKIERQQPESQITTSQQEDAMLYGWLKEVNWHNGTAQLHRYTGEYIRLRFSSDLSDTMRRLATQFVEVRGNGRLNPHDRWTSVQIEEISATRSWNEPFDLETFLNDPAPKIFDAENVVTVSEPFNADEFIKIIHEGRDVKREK